MSTATMLMENFDDAITYADEAKVVAEWAGILGPDSGRMMLSG